jgi:hypothetical protein
LRYADKCPIRSSDCGAASRATTTSRVCEAGGSTSPAGFPGRLGITPVAEGRLDEATQVVVSERPCGDNRRARGLETVRVKISNLLQRQITDGGGVADREVSVRMITVHQAQKCPLSDGRR